jgi:hypothetical protein
LPSDGQQQPCRLWSRKPQALDPKGSLLTNRMSELFTYGSVGDVGRKPGSYPAANRSQPIDPPRNGASSAAGSGR